MPVNDCDCFMQKGAQANLTCDLYRRSEGHTSLLLLLYGTGAVLCMQYLFKYSLEG